MEPMRHCKMAVKGKISSHMKKAIGRAEPSAADLEYVACDLHVPFVLRPTHLFSLRRCSSTKRLTRSRVKRTPERTSSPIFMAGKIFTPSFQARTGWIVTSTVSISSSGYSALSRFSSLPAGKHRGQRLDL